MKKYARKKFFYGRFATLKSLLTIFQEVSGKNYFNILQAYQNIRIVSILGAELLEHAFSNGMKAEHMHLIGFSLGEFLTSSIILLKPAQNVCSGAHTASLVAKQFTERTDKKVGRLTGLGSTVGFLNCLSQSICKALKRSRSGWSIC